MNRAILTLRITFDYSSEYEYAAAITEMVDRARELANAEIIGAVDRFELKDDQ